MAMTVDEITQKLEGFQTQIQQAQSALDQHTGQKQTLLDQLEKETGVKSVEEAKTLLTQLQVDREQMFSGLQTRMVKLTEDFQKDFS